jgi:hypothetical protein
MKDKLASGVYEHSNSSYRSRWFCVLKKDGKSLQVVHSLEPLNAVAIRDASVPPMTDTLAESFACHSAYSSFDLYVSFDQRRLDQKSRDLPTFHSPLGVMQLTVILMGYTNSPQIMHGDMGHILQDEIPKYTQHFVDDVPVKGPSMRYKLPDGGYKTIPKNSSICQFIWELCLATN